MKKTLIAIFSILAAVLLFFIATQLIIPTPDLSVSFDLSENDKILTYTVENKSFATLVGRENTLQREQNGAWENVSFRSDENALIWKAFHSHTEDLALIEPLTEGNYRLTCTLYSVALRKKTFHLVVEFTVP